MKFTELYLFMKKQKNKHEQLNLIINTENKYGVPSFLPYPFYSLAETLCVMLGYLIFGLIILAELSSF